MLSAKREEGRVRHRLSAGEKLQRRQHAVQVLLPTQFDTAAQFCTEGTETRRKALSELARADVVAVVVAATFM